MQRHAQSQEMFHKGSVETDEISPSITIRRTRRVQGGKHAVCDLVFTEQLWAPINNTLAGCSENEAWQSAKQWIIVTDESYNGLASSMLQGCEVMSSEGSDVLLVTPKRLTETLLSMSASSPTVIVLAVDRDAIDFCTKQFDVWMQTCSSPQSKTSELHMLWLPTSRAEQTLPAHSQLEALPWSSYSVLCDLSNLPTTDDAIRESILIMLRTAVFIDAQFMYWMEGNLSAMAETDESLHHTAMMRAAQTIFTVKRRRSNEPAIPMAFTDTAALRNTTPANDETPRWEVLARQLYLDVLYAHAAQCLADSEVERINRVMDSLGILTAAKNTQVVTPNLENNPDNAEPFVVLKELGAAIYAGEFEQAAWAKANE